MSTSLQLAEQIEGSDSDLDACYPDPVVDTYLFEPVETSVLRHDLDAMPPGLELAWTLAGVDVDSLCGYDRVVVLRAHDRMVSFHQARRLDAMRSVHTSMGDLEVTGRPEEVGDLASAEIQCALNLTRRAADIELSLALELAHRIPQVLPMLADGAIDVARVKVIDRGTLHLTASVAQGVVERVAASAPNMTTGQLAARIRKLCIEANPADATDRYTRSVADRRVVMEPTVDGTAHLKGMGLPPERVQAIRQRINDLAKGLRGPNEDRTMDQLRADVFMDLLQGHHFESTGASKSTVHLTADLTTLTGIFDHPGELAGYGPVIADIARQVADAHPDAQWTYSITDAEHGHTLHTGVTRRRPTQAHQREIRARHHACCWPGCRMPAVDCDLDHTIRYTDGGATCPCNQVPLCRHHHTLRHAGFTYTVDSNNTVTWTSRLGHTYNTWHDPT